MTLMILRRNKYSRIARKGPRKYYRLHEEDLLTDKEYYSLFDTSLSRDEGEFQTILKNQVFRNYSLSPVYQALSEGNHIEIYRSVLTVGEHAQISWLSEEQVWVIANQNASVFMKTPEDLDKYRSAPKPLFAAVLSIGQFWHTFYNENIQDKKGFIKAIEGKTLCATFVTANSYITLLEYERSCLLFHAIVENESHNGTCLPPDQSYAFFQKWRFDTAPLSRVGEFSNYTDLVKNISSLHKNISESLLKEEELGAVLYFVLKNGTEEVLSMAKIETKESLCFKELIRILRLFWRNHEDVAKWNEELEREYNNAFNSFKFYLEGLNIKGFEIYITIARH